MSRSISKKTRFEVFKRDNFKCRYCGIEPPNTVLEIDHMIPVSKGGKNEIDNLFTSCFSCNRGKSNNLLTEKNILSIDKQSIEELKEAISQYKHIQKLKDKIAEIKQNDYEKIQILYWNAFNESIDYKNKVTINKFLKELGFEIVYDAMENAISKCDYDTDAFRYFCGICWNKIKGN